MTPRAAIYGAYTIDFLRRGSNFPNFPFRHRRFDTQRASAEGDHYSVAPQDFDTPQVHGD